MSNMSKIFRCLFSVRICTIFSPSSLSGTTIIYCLYYYSFSIHFRDHLAIILNVTVGFLSLLYLLLFSSGFKNLHETFEILETLCTQLSQLSHFSHTYFEPYYLLIIPYFCPYYVLLLCRLLAVQNFYLVLFTLLVPFIQPVPFLLYLFLFCFTCSFFASKGNNPHI